MTISIVAENICKAYKVYAKPMDLFYELVTKKKRHTEFIALRDISFELYKGEMVAFIGRNGAGKSTLLKILAGTLDHTAGSFTVKGKVASILELGTGFNPEYTGRENVQLGGLCLGLTRQEIASKIDWIRDFSELGEFFDRPFKTYSSGMQARLTFATASCVEPEVLIVDEALSVGDIKFQVKCFDRLRNFRRDGGTVLLVSHDLNTINTFCDRVYYLKDGVVVLSGQPKAITDAYYRDMFAPAEATGTASLGGVKARVASDAVMGGLEAVRLDDPDNAIGQSLEAGTIHLPDLPPPTLAQVGAVLAQPPKLGNGDGRIIAYGLYDQHGHNVQVCSPNEPYLLHMRVLAVRELPAYQAGFVMKNNKGVHIYGTGTHTHRIPLGSLQPGEVRDLFFETMLPVINFPVVLSLGIANGETTIFDFSPDALVLTPYASPDAFPDSFIHVNNVFRFGPSWNMPGFKGQGETG